MGINTNEFLKDVD